MIRLPVQPAASGSAPLEQDRHWRAALLWTIHDLKTSHARRRTLSLPNLCRLFDRRWQQTGPVPQTQAPGRQLGRAFLRQYYLAHQPFCLQTETRP